MPIVHCCGATCLVPLRLSHVPSCVSQPCCSFPGLFQSPLAEQPEFVYFCNSAVDGSQGSLTLLCSSDPHPTATSFPEELLAAFQFLFPVTYSLKSAAHMSPFFISPQHPRDTDFFPLYLAQSLLVRLYCTWALSSISCVATGSSLNLSVPTTSSSKQNGKSITSSKFYGK